MRLLLALSLLAWAAEPLAAGEVTLTPSGVACPVGNKGVFTLGIPALDGRGAHAPVIPSSIQTDGQELTAKFGPPFDGATVHMKVLPDDNVEYTYDSLPEDARLVMCQFNIPNASIEDDLKVTFDQKPPVTIPVEPGKTNDDVRLASLNAHRLEIKWASGESLSLDSPFTCWHGIQDARVWGKGFVGVCLTPPLKRDASQTNRSTFTLSFSFTKGS